MLTGIFVKPQPIAAPSDTIPKIENPLKEKKSAIHPNLCCVNDVEYDSSEENSSRDSSILDVNNDQMFDDSIFTEYDEQNISTMSQKMSKQWRKKFKAEGKRKEKKIKNTFSLEKLVQYQLTQDEKKARVNDKQSCY